MSTESLLVILIVGGIAGWLAGLFMRGSGYGIIGDIIVGVVGSFIGSYLLAALHVSVRTGNPYVDLGIVAFVGAIVLILIIGLIRPRSLSDDRGWWRRR